MSVEDIAVVLAESLIDSEREKITGPLVRRMAWAAGARIRRQAAFFMRRGVPVIQQWPNPSENEIRIALYALSDYRDERFPKRFERYTSAAYEAGAKDAATVFEGDSEVMLPAYGRTAETLMRELDETTGKVIVAAVLEAQSAQEFRRLVKAKLKARAKAGAAATGDYEISKAFHAGMLAILDVVELEEAAKMQAIRRVPARKIRKYWAPQPTACDLCSTNADQGAIPARRAFESGHDAPPAHPHCMCSLVLLTVD